MKKGKTLHTIIIFFIGSVVGVAVLILIAAIDGYVRPITSLTWPKKFGDTTIWVNEPDEFIDGENTSELDVSKMMFMAKGGIPFLAVGMNKSGKVDNLSLLDEGERTILLMTASADPAKWERLIYSSPNDAPNDVRNTTGEMYVDNNFDGRFDIKYFFNDFGEKVSREIYIDQTWKKVDYCNFKKAKSGQTTYIFDIDSGWQVDK